MKKFLVILLLLGALTGCDKELDFSGFKNKPEVVVQGHFTNDSLLQIKLNYTSDIMSSVTNNYIGDANVKVIDSNNVAYQLMHTGNGIYQANMFPIPGMFYKLFVETNDQKIIKATDKIPDYKLLCALDTLTGPLNRLDVKLHFIDPVSTKNFYIIRLLEYSSHYIQNANDNSKVDTVSGWFALPVVSSNNIFKISNSLNGNLLNFEMFDDEFLNGQNYTLNLLINRSELEGNELKTPSDSVIVYLKSVNESCFNYYLGVIRNSKNYGGPFSTNFNPTDNIENGLGIFSGYQYYRKVISLK